jgi:hypothetical protein
MSGVNSPGVDILVEPAILQPLIILPKVPWLQTMSLRIKWHGYVLLTQPSAHADFSRLLAPSSATYLGYR